MELSTELIRDAPEVADEVTARHLELARIRENLPLGAWTLVEEKPSGLRWDGVRDLVAEYERWAIERPGCSCGCECCADEFDESLSEPMWVGRKWTYTTTARLFRFDPAV